MQSSAGKDPGCERYYCEAPALPSCTLLVIDLHCHILPALDDGALDLAHSVAMAREAESDGIAVV